MDEVPIEMAIFNIYVSLPQGIIYVLYIYIQNTYLISTHQSICQSVQLNQINGIHLIKPNLIQFGCVLKWGKPPK